MLRTSQKIDESSIPYARSSIAIFRAIAVLAFLSLIMVSAPDLWEILAGSIIDGYVGVTTFVALTLFILYGLEVWTKVDFGTFVARYPRAQVAIASFLGALPGCGGAVMVVTQYVRGGLSFGGLVATLTATMGDAAFVLLAADPQIGGLVIATGFVVGMVAGYIVDLFPVPAVLKDELKSKNANKPMPAIMNPKFWQPIDYLWVGIMIPGIVIGIGSALQYDMNLVFDASGNTIWADNIALIGGLLAITTFLGAPAESMPHAVHMNPHNTLRRRVVAETSFITVWVVVGFAAYDMFMHITGADLKTIFQTVAPIVPLMAILVGWLPGCGPQIVTTTLYINGTIPLSGLLGNAISNDGDALFPALALSPKAAIYATAYSTVPALIVAYAWYFAFEYGA